MRTHSIALLMLAACTGLIAPSCAASDDPESLAEIEQMLPCEDCENPEDPDPTGGGVPAPCGGVVYSNPSSSPKYPSNLSQRFRNAHDYAGRAGYPMGFLNFHQANYPGTGEVRGMSFVAESAYAGWEDVPVSVLGSASIDDIPEMMRLANDYAVAHGYKAGMPTFHQAVYNGVHVRGVAFFRHEAVEFRDVPACELGNPDLNDVGQMMRGANDYAGRHGFSAGFPTFHTASYGNGPVYGVMLFNPGTTDWQDVRYADLDTWCGGNFQSACPGTQCDTGAPYHYDNRCHIHPYKPPPCGAEGERCCSGGTCVDPSLECGSSGIFSDSKCFAPVPVPPSTAVGMSRDWASWFRYDSGHVNSPLLGQEALVVSVKNMSDRSIQLRHVDKSNRTFTEVVGAYQEVTGSFVGSTVSGGWSADISGTQPGSPAQVTLTIKYRAP
jgi:hypothetical protein